MYDLSAELLDSITVLQYLLQYYSIVSAVGVDGSCAVLKIVVLLS